MTGDDKITDNLISTRNSDVYTTGCSYAPGA
jgi:hypothetical protein